MMKLPHAQIAARRISVWDLAVERAKVYIEEYKDIKNPNETMDEMLGRTARIFGVDPVKLKEAVKQ